MISAEKLKPLTKGIMSHPYIAGGVATGAIGGYAIRKDPEDAIIGAGLGAGAGYLLHNRVPTKLLPQEIKKAAINTKAIKQLVTINDTLLTATAGGIAGAVVAPKGKKVKGALIGTGVGAVPGLLHGASRGKGTAKMYEAFQNIKGSIPKTAALFLKNKYPDLGADGSHPIMANAKTSKRDEPHADLEKDFTNGIANAMDGSLNKVSAFGNVMAGIMQKAIAHPRIAGAAIGGTVGGIGGALTAGPDNRGAGMLTGAAMGAGAGALGGKAMVAGAQKLMAPVAASSTAVAPKLLNPATPKLLPQNVVLGKQQMIDSAATARAVTGRNAAVNDAHLNALRMNAKPFANTLPDDSSFKIIKRGDLRTKILTNPRTASTIIGGIGGGVIGAGTSKDKERGAIVGASAGAAAGYLGGAKIIDKVMGHKQLVANTRTAVSNGFDLNKFERGLGSMASSDINKTIENIPNVDTRKAAFKIYQQHLKK